MTPPTSEEIRAAWELITRDGPQADTTLRLAALALTDPILKSWLKNVEERLAQIPEAGPAARDGARIGALIYGLNLGLRIGEARRAETMIMIGRVMGADIYADTADEPRAKRIGQVMSDFFVLARGENVPVCLPPLAYCRSCEKFVPWLWNQGEIVCDPAHHVIAGFSEAAS